MKSRVQLTLGIFMLSALVAAMSPAFACSDNPTPGTTVIPSPLTTLYPESTGYPSGVNLIEIPAFSPVNKSPNNPQENGFQQLCDIFGLRGTPSTIRQIDPTTGNFNTFICNQAAAPDFLPCQGVWIDLEGVTPPIQRYIPVGDSIDVSGVEGSWVYSTYGHPAFFGVPLTIASTSPEVLCQQLGFSAGTQVAQFLADTGQIKTHTCGQAPQFSVRPGEALYITPNATGAHSTGQVTIN